MTQPSDPSRLLRDPVGYANRPLEPEFDEYAAVREHVERLVVPADLILSELGRPKSLARSLR